MSEQQDFGVSDETLVVSGVQELPSYIGRGILIPEMSEEEVAASMVSRGKRLVPIYAPNGISTRQFRSTISAAFMYYTKYNSLPKLIDVQHLLADQIPLAKVKTIFVSPQFRHAMLTRGIDFGETRTISPEQDMAMAIMASPDGRTFERKLKAAGVSPSKWRSWLKQKAFGELWREIGGSSLKDYEPDMMVALTGQALTGDVQAIKYAFEVSGKYAPQRQQNLDATLVIAQVIEILQDELKDDMPRLQRIATRMQLVGEQPAARRMIEDAKSLFADEPEIEIDDEIFGA